MSSVSATSSKDYSAVSHYQQDWPYELEKIMRDKLKTLKTVYIEKEERYGHPFHNGLTLQMIENGPVKVVSEDGQAAFAFGITDPQQHTAIYYINLQQTFRKSLGSWATVSPNLITKLTNELPATDFLTAQGWQVIERILNKQHPSLQLVEKADNIIPYKSH